MTQERAQQDSRITGGRRDWSTWPGYEAAVLGYREYWYPAGWSRDITRRVRRIRLVGEDIALTRSPAGITAKRVRDGRAVPVADRVGLLWIYIGEQEPRPVEDDMPSELLGPDALVVGRITTRPGNWRFGAENGFDDGHAKYLHRKSLWVWRRQMPTYTRMRVSETGEGWLTRLVDEVHYETDFGTGLGTWPRSYPRWKKRGRGGARTSIRLPAMLRVEYATWSHFEWWVGVEPDEHIYVQLAATHASGWQRLKFRLYYLAWVRWVFHGMFNDEDRLMVDVMDAPPERLYRPDVSLTEWRRLCERTARGEPVTAAPESVPERAQAAPALVSSAAGSEAR